MPKNIKGHLSVGQKIVSIIVSIGTAVLHAFLAKKGINIPMDSLINPATTGALAGAITATVLKGTGKTEQK